MRTMIVASRATEVVWPWTQVETVAEKLVRAPLLVSVLLPDAAGYQYQAR